MGGCRASKSNVACRKRSYLLVMSKNESEGVEAVDGAAGGKFLFVSPWYLVSRYLASVVLEVLVAVEVAAAAVVEVEMVAFL